MNVFDLSAKLSLDSKDYDRSLQNASSSAEKWATRFTMAAKAVGSVSKQIFGLAKQAVDSFADFQQLEGGIQTLFGAQGKSFEEWSKTFEQSSDSMGDYIDIARKVINGDFGVGADRKDLLSQAGYDPDTVQQMVDNLIRGVDAASGISADTIAANMQSAEEKYADLMAAQDYIMNSAQNAFHDAGVSANTYMENVSAFAAALRASTDSSYDAAVIANQAMVDMADNANKMGTPLENVQAAFQGFAKQNYTMLDNLKLGYGGTKTEMERLLKDAEKFSGIKYDINNLSDVYEAIHVIQEEMGIAGTTAEEAEKTISGSTGMMKAAWQNMLTAMVTGGDNFNDSVKDLVYSVKTVVKNVAPALKAALEGVGALISGVAPEIIGMLPGMVNDLVPGFVDATKSIIDSILDAAPGLLQALSDVIPMIIDSLVDLIPSIIDFLVEGIPMFIGTGVSMLTALVSGLADNVGEIIPQLTQGLIDIVDQIGTILNTGGVSFADAALTLLKNLADALVKAVPDVLTQITQLIQDLTASMGNAAKGESFISTAVTILTKFATDLAESVPKVLTDLTAAAAAFITEFATLAAGDTKTLANGAISILNTLITGLSDSIPAVITDLTTAIMAIIGAIIDVITGLDIQTFAEACVTIVKALADGIVGAVSEITKKLPELITALVAWLTDPANLAGMYGAAIEIFGELVSDIPAIIASLAEGLAGIVKGIYDYFKDHGGEILDGIKDGFSSVGIKLTEAWNEKIKPAFEELGKKFRDWLSEFDWGEALLNFAGKIGNGIKSGWEKVKGAFTDEDGFFGKVKGWVGGLDLGDAGQKVADGLKNGIQGSWDGLKATFTAAEGFAGKIGSWLGELDLKGAGDSLVSSLKKGLESAWEGIKTWFTNKFTHLFDDIDLSKLAFWKKWFKGGEEGDTGSEEEPEPGDVEMPEGMLKLDYNNLEPIPTGTLESYQYLAERITAINDAIGSEAEETGLNYALKSLSDLFGTLLTSAQTLADYFAGGFIVGIDLLLQHICQTDTDEEGKVDAGGGNTLYTAFGSVYGLFQDIYATSQLLAQYWSGTFINASETMRTEAGYAIGALQSLANVAASTAANFMSATGAIYDLIDAYLALRRVKAGGGSGSSRKGNIVDDFKASGGPVGAGGSYVVGEQGPELFVPQRSGQIVSTESLKDLLNGGRRSPQIVVNFNGDVIGDARTIESYVNRAAKRAIREEVYAGA